MYDYTDKVLETPFGEIELDDIEFNNLLKKTQNLIHEAMDAAIIFMSDELVLPEDISDEIKGDLIDNAFDLETMFSESSKVRGLIEYVGDVDIIEIEEHSDVLFEAEGEKYYVMTDDEANSEALERAQIVIEDELEYFNESEREYIIDNYVDTDWFDDAMQDYNESYADDIENENAEHPYINRLHEEMVERNVLFEPDWPEGPDEYDYEYDYEDFDVVGWEIDNPEPDEDDFEDSDEYAEAFDEWQDKFDQAREEWNDEQDRLEAEAKEEYETALEEYENETEEYKQELEDDVYNAKEEFVESLNDDYDDGYDYYKSNFGIEQTYEIIKSNNLIKVEEAAQYLIDSYGREQYIGQEQYEDSVSFEYKGVKYDYYIFK